MGAHEPNPEAKAGICYVETKSLDGETNLKIRQAIRPAIGRVSNPQDAACLKGRVEMEHPNKLIENFDGAIELEGNGGTCRFVAQMMMIEQVENSLFFWCRASASGRNLADKAGGGVGGMLEARGGCSKRGFA